jgi:hypothetical protein
MGAKQNLRIVPRLTYRMTVFTARSIPMDSTFNAKREFFSLLSTRDILYPLDKKIFMNTMRPPVRIFMQSYVFANVE